MNFGIEMRTNINIEQWRIQRYCKILEGDHQHSTVMCFSVFSLLMLSSMYFAVVLCIRQCKKSSKEEFFGWI